MTLDELSASVLRISDIYAREHGIERDRDWAEVAGTGRGLR